MARHLGTPKILAGASLFSSLCCVRYYCICDVRYRGPRFERGRPSIITPFDCLLDHAQTLPSLVARQRTKNLTKVPPCDTATPDATIETPLINHGERIDYGTTTVQVESSSADLTTTSPENKPALLNRGLIMVYLNFAILAFLDMGHFVLLPLFYSTSIPLGGLGLDPYKIGLTLGCFGCINAVVQARFLGPLIREFGARKVYIMSFPGLLFCVTLYPIIRHFAQRFGRVNNVVIVCMIIQLSFQVLILSTYGTLSIFSLVQVTSSDFILKALCKLSWHSMYLIVNIWARLLALLRCLMLQ